MRPDCVSACIDHVTYMEKQMDKQMDKQMLSSKHICQSFESFEAPKTAIFKEA